MTARTLNTLNVRPQITVTMRDTSALMLETARVSETLVQKREISETRRNAPKKQPTWDYWTGKS